LTFDSVRDGAELICLGTNDSWFFDSAALYMHNAQAQLRAIENGRYLVRAANTGISTVITPRGEVIAELEPLVGGNIYATVYARDNKTLCTALGNSFVLLLIAGFVFLATENIFHIKKKKSRKP
jgi:apolipoprotein N-acyltransferase